MKALIVAAGKGKRLGAYTADLPKCLLPVADKSIIDHQLDALHANGISDIAIVKGYLADTIQRESISSEFINDDFENNNILSSMMYAADFLDEDTIVSYSDIIYSKEVVATLIDAPYDITAVTDVDWRGRYINRHDHPESEAEKVLFQPHTAVAEKFGKVIDASPEHIGEFIGLYKLSKDGARVFKDAFHEARLKFDNEQFMHAKSFANAYITDMFNYLIQQGNVVNCAFIQKGWWEIDTEEELLYLVNSMTLSAQ